MYNGEAILSKLKSMCKDYPKSLLAALTFYFPDKQPVLRN